MVLERTRAGEALALPSGRPHSVEALRDSTLLITIIPDGQKEVPSP